MKQNFDDQRSARNEARRDTVGKYGKFSHEFCAYDAELLVKDGIDVELWEVDDKFGYTHAAIVGSNYDPDLIVAIMGRDPFVTAITALQAYVTYALQGKVPIDELYGVSMKRAYATSIFILKAYGSEAYDDDQQMAIDDLDLCFPRCSLFEDFEDHIVDPAGGSTSAMITSAFTVEPVV